MKVPEPWMFGVEVTVDGEPVQGRPQVMRFTLMGRIRMAWRRLRGRPAFDCTLISD